MFSVNVSGQRSYVQDGGKIAGVEYVRTDGDRDVWRWWVSTLPVGSWDGEELTTPSAFGKDSGEVLRTLASFMEAHAESGEGSENRDIFPFDPDLSGECAEMIRAEYGYDD